MDKISYVYPNVSGIRQRGGLRERWQLGQQLGCEYIEMPADFIKNKTEMERTGLHLGDFLTDDAVTKLYTSEDNLPADIKYILHTEPSLSRRDGYGLSHQAALQWHNKQWVDRLVDMVIAIADYLARPPSAIEIHPGDRRNTYEDIVHAANSFLTRLNDAFGVEPFIMLENRTGQFISDGDDIKTFWHYLKDNHSAIADKVGIVLDVQQLYTVTKERFLEQYHQIPSQCIKGYHIHSRHNLPSLKDDIPWKQVFEEITKIPQDIIINPEILHKSKVKGTIQFCSEMIN
jgi:hypothetical protein